jgi:DNA-directed RNA polymerase sigma subunit (sigma70/sigma32)
MPRHEDKTLSEDQRKELFLALVQAQDSDMSVPQSRKMIAKEFGVSEQRVKQIEQEGLEGQWPPLA